MLFQQRVSAPGGRAPRNMRSFMEKLLHAERGIRYAWRWGDEILHTQLYGDYFINQYKDPYNKPISISWKGHKGFEGRMELDDSQVRELSPWGYFSHFLAISGWMKYILLHRYDIYILSTFTYTSWRRDSEMYLSNPIKKSQTVNAVLESMMDFSCPRNAWPRPCCQGNNVKLKNSFDGSDSTAGVMMIAMTKLLQARTRNFYLKNADILVAKSSFDLWPYRCHGRIAKFFASGDVTPREIILIDFPRRIWRFFFPVLVNSFAKETIRFDGNFQQFQPLGWYLVRFGCI